MKNFGLIYNNTSLVIDLIPVVGDAKGIIECVVGKDLITGRELSGLERGLCALSIIPLIGDGGSLIKAGVKGGIGSILKVLGKEGAENVAFYIGSAVMEEVGANPLWGFAFYQFGRTGWKSKDKIIDSLKNIDTSSGIKSSSIEAIIKKHGLTIDKFNELRLTDVDKLSKEEVEMMKAIREDIPKITTKTYIQKTIPECDIDGYLSNGWNQIGGYVAKYDDVSHIKNYDDVVESSRLDYVTASGVRPYPDGGDTYGYIKFKTKSIDEISIPYGKKFGGTNIDPPPCTLNGFTAARNGEIVPEWCLNNRVTPKKGSELYKVVNGVETLIAKFYGKKFVKVRQREK